MARGSVSRSDDDAAEPLLVCADDDDELAAVALLVVVLVVMEKEVEGRFVSEVEVERDDAVAAVDVVALTSRDDVVEGVAKH